MKKFIIIDGNAIVHRAYHALPPLTAKDGTMVNAVFGFTSMLLKVINDLKPDYLAVSFDMAGDTFRDEIYKDYKATRIKADQDLYDQIPLCYEITEAFDIPIYTRKGYEADDVIASVITKNKNKNIKNIIVTGDMDLLQLVDKQTSVYGLRKGMSDIVEFDAKEVDKKYGFGPEHVVDYKSLRGDASDNIPGVPGIGEKTAKELITKFGSLENIYKNYKKDKDLKPGVIKKLDEGKENAQMSKELATIIKNIPGLGFKIEETKVNKFDLDKISKLFKKFEFFSLLKRIPGAPHAKDTPIKISQRTKLIETNNIQEVEKMLKDVKIFSCKEILNGANVLDSKLIGLVLVTDKKSLYYKNSKDISKIFSNKNKILVGHDLKQLIKALQLQGVEIKTPLFDIMIASYLLNSSTKAHDLRAIALRELGEELPQSSDQASLFGTDPSTIAYELDLILKIQKKFQKELEDKEDLGLFEKVEMNLIPVLANMELNGIAVDTKMLAELSKDVAKAIDKVSKKIWHQADTEFNIASSLQLREILFDKLELPTEGVKKGKTGYSTADSELDKLLNVHPIIPLIREYRELAKLQNTYVDVLPKLLNHTTNRIHTNFNQAVTTTGRLSSSDPNLQNIPIRTELGKKVRDTFVAEPGNVLISVDYSQIELRIVASLAQDKKMIEIFKKGEDIHQATAAAINGVKLSEVTKDMRYAAKEVNFGVLYGMGAYGLSWRTKIPQWEAKEFIDKYFKQFAGVKKYIDQTLKFAKKEGYVETLFGRRRYIPELQSDNYQLRNAGERMAINMPIQGTAADIIKMAMIKVYENLAMIKNVKLILQVHDELVLEVKKGTEDKISKLVKEAMESVVKLHVPTEVHVGVGKSWGELK